MLREGFALRSLKEGCGRGECGTCTVLLDGKPVTACMVASGQVEGRSVMTLEGLEGNESFRRIQRAFMETGAVQCGFCTPGFLIAAYALLRDNPSPGREDIRRAVSGNLCRCTGYTKIIDAVERAGEILR